MNEIQPLNPDRKSVKYNSIDEIEYVNNNLSTWEMIKLTVCMAGFQFTCEYFKL